MIVRLTFAFLILPGFALVLAFVPADDRATPVASAVVPDTAIAEYHAGRYWHAARILRAVDPLTLEGRLWLARSEAGYRNWTGVLDALDGVDAVELVEAASPAAGATVGEVWTLRAMALDESDRDAEADAAWETALSAGVVDPAVVRARRARIAFALLPEGGTEVTPEARAAALARLDSVTIDLPALAAAVAAEAIEARVEAGDTTTLRHLRSRASAPFTGPSTWTAVPRALLAAGDTAAGVSAWERLREGETSAERRARADEALGELALAAGDSVTATEHFLAALEGAPASSAGRRAARGVVDLALDRLDPATAFAAAVALDRLGDGRRALAAYDRHLGAVRAAGAEPTARARLERARLASSVPDRVDEAIEEFRALDEYPDPAIGARALEIWAGVRRRQGETEKLDTLRQWLVERYPDTDAAAGIVFLRADAAQDRERFDTAVGLYREVIEMASERSHAGQARMRIAQIELGRGDPGEAARVYEAYLADFPNGRRWEEAAYWAARLRYEEGDEEAARAHIGRLRRDAPLTYYSVRAEALLGLDFRLDLLGVSSEPAVVNPLPLGFVDQLEAAGLPAAAERWIEARSREITDPEGLLRLAEALNARGRTVEGISTGWRLREMGRPWDRRLVEVVYPFIYREMVSREAEEWGLDPVLVSALIRQESAWAADIRSRAGAIGLMQVMPATGAQVARAEGMEGFSAAALETPEVNLHLGSRFLREMIDRYGEDLPLVLSAYNAGPTRADRWRAFPEAADPERFTERIPFAETRGYVKSVTRNVELYEALYGETLRSAAQQPDRLPE
ncbi:MAG: transglycosylase SLT domain-containing protein [Longimicrobiales bacterium]|nr:transglycosylase SLT domain-containing protein [Longimicrobiales bacterium]